MAFRSGKMEMAGVQCLVQLGLSWWVPWHPGKLGYPLNHGSIGESSSPDGTENLCHQVMPGTSKMITKCETQKENMGSMRCHPSHVRCQKSCGVSSLQLSQWIDDHPPRSATQLKRPWHKSLMKRSWGIAGAWPEFSRHDEALLDCNHSKVRVDQTSG